MKTNPFSILPLVLLLGSLNIFGEGSALMVKAGRYRFGKVVKVNMDTGEEKQILNDGYGLCFSPDGTRIAFISGSQIYIAWNDGTHVSEPLAKVKWGRAFLRWSPQGYIRWLDSFGDKHSLNLTTLEDINHGFVRKNTGGDISWDGNRGFTQNQAASNQVYKFWMEGDSINGQLVDGSNSLYSGKCTATISIDGKYIFHSVQGHGEGQLWNYEGPKHWKTVYPANPPGALHAYAEFHGHRFSSSSPNHLIYELNKHSPTKAYVLDIHNSDIESHLYIGDGWGQDYWPGKLPPPGEGGSTIILTWAQKNNGDLLKNISDENHFRAYRSYEIRGKNKIGIHYEKRSYNILGTFRINH